MSYLSSIVTFILIFSFSYSHAEDDEYTKVCGVYQLEECRTKLFFLKNNGKINLTMDERELQCRREAGCTPGTAPDFGRCLDECYNRHPDNNDRIQDCAKDICQVRFPESGSKNDLGSGDEPEEKAEDLSSEIATKVSDWDKKYNNICRVKEDRAKTCCGDSPASCVSEAFNANEKKSNIGFQVINALGQGAVALSGSIGQLCGNMKTVAAGATAINLALSATCERMVGLCKNECGELVEEIKNAKVEIKERALKSQINITTQLGSLNTVLGLAEKSIQSCRTANNGTIRAAAAAYSSFQAAKLADVCKKQAGNELEVDTNSFDVNCSAAGASANPICQAQCQAPGAENDPICQSILQNLAGTNTAVNFASGAEADETFDVAGIFEDDQEVNVGDIAEGTSTTATASPSGGGGLSGGGGGGGGGGSSGAGGIAGARNPSSILKGTKSGNGYSAGGSKLRSGSGGGYRGPASGSAKGAYKKGKKFSLKDFLPGGKANPKRGLAGFSRSKNSQLGAKTDDLFNRITARFYEICLKNRLYDCSTITKRKRRGR